MIVKFITWLISKIHCNFELIQNVNHTAVETYTYELRTRASLRFPRDQAAFIRTSSDSS